MLSVVLLIALMLAPCALAANNYEPLSNCDIMRRGSRGSNVTRIQQALSNLGYLSGRVDGSYGAQTESAVREFQVKNGITPSGVATMFTQAKLYGTDAITAWNTNRRYGSGSGEYAVQNSGGDFMEPYACTVSFDFVNRDANNVEAICIYYWLADSRNNIVRHDGYEYYIQWYYGMNLGYGGVKTVTNKLSAPKGAWRDTATIRCVVGEIAYTDGTVVVSMNAARKPYENLNYILKQNW